MPKVTEVTSLSQFHEIIQSDRYSVFDFWAPWCGPCRIISPVFEKISDLPENGHVGFYKVDIDEQPEISHELSIRVMPTFILFQKGLSVASTQGAIPANLYGLIAKAVKPTESEPQAPQAVPEAPKTTT